MVNLQQEKLRIVILDAQGVNPGDLSWDCFASLGELCIYPFSEDAQVAERIGNAQIALTNKSRITREVMEACPELRYIGVLATGYNAVDIEQAHQRGICVTNIPAYSTMAVAQHTFALLLEACNRTALHIAGVRAGKWERSKSFCYWEQTPVELAGKTLGIIGLGAIGRQVARIGRQFGMEVLAYSRTPGQEEGVRNAELAEVLRESDVLSLHCPLNAQTRHLLRRETLAQMKRGAILINTGRGELIAEEDVYAALEQGQLSWYLADVYTQEPPRGACRLLHHERAMITPHYAWASLEARRRLLEIAQSNLRHFLKGTAQNCV